MSAALALVRGVQAAGGQIAFADGRLKLSAPEPLPDGLVNELRTHKAEVLFFLQGQASSGWYSRHLSGLAARHRRFLSRSVLVPSGAGSLAPAPGTAATAGLTASNGGKHGRTQGNQPSHFIQ